MANVMLNVSQSLDLLERLTDPRASIAPPTLPIWGCLCILQLSSPWSSIPAWKIEPVVVQEAIIDTRNLVISSC